MWMKWTEGVRYRCSPKIRSGQDLSLAYLAHFFREAYGFNTGNKLQFILVSGAQEGQQLVPGRASGNGH